MTSQHFLDVQKWLTISRIHRLTFRLDWLDHQDGLWCLPSFFYAPALIQLWHTPNAKSDRRDYILYAIVLHAEQLLTPWETSTESEESAREELIAFCKLNWQEILRINTEMGFHEEFSDYVVPAVSEVE